MHGAGLQENLHPPSKVNGDDCAFLRVCPARRLQTDVASAYEPDSEDQEAAEQIARDGVRPLRAGDPLELRGLQSLLSSARHELGSPMQSIQGFSELLASESSGALNREQHSFLEHILAASNELRSAMDACMELAELELVGRAPNMARLDLERLLTDALAQAERRTGSAASVQPSARRASARLDRDLFQRALETLLVALSTRDQKRFVVAVEADGEYARVTVARTARQGHGEPVSLPALAARRSITRNLLWFRLAAALFAAQDVGLCLAESLDYAEVRVRLSPTH
jgi:signal transduction histidine kinase